MYKKILVMIIMSFLLVGCFGDDQEYPSSYPASKSYTIDEILYPGAPNILVLDSEIAKIDYSNANEGYIMAFLKTDISKKVKIQIAKDERKYNYDLTTNSGVAYPLQMGNGKYIIKILENIEGNQYAIKNSIEIDVVLDDELKPYLYPNILVNYKPNDKITSLAIEIVKDADNDLKRIKEIYEYVANYLSYDDKKAKLAKQEYLIPDLEEIIKTKQGICFDYASMMVAMLRINHIPARLICGGTDKDEYHAWLEVYLDGKGWINPDIFIDKDIWTIMDPTFASNKYDYDGNYEATSYY